MKRRRRLHRRLRTADSPRRPPRPTRPGGSRLRHPLRRRRWFRLSKATASAPPRRPGGPSRVRLRHPLRGGHLYPKPRSAHPPKRPAPKTPRMRPRRTVVERVMPSGEPAPARTVVRLRVIGLLVAALFSLMFIRLWYLQVLDTSAYSQAVTANEVRDVEIPSPRGLIVDRSGNVMVGDQVTEDITLSRVSAQQHPAVVDQLAAVLGVAPAQIESDLANTQYSLYKPVPIVENAPLSEVLYIGEHASMFPGVSAVADTNRTYPMGQTGVQLLGYVGQIDQAELKDHASAGYQLGDAYGQSGLENEYESALRGQPGVQRVEVNAQQQVVGSLGETAPRPGDDVVTNIDAGLEQTLQSALDSAVASLHGSSKGGAAVALDPQTGAVLALVSSPTYDPTWWTPDGISEAHYQQLEANNGLNDLAIDGLYTPGSTFKLATATAALQDGLITPNSVIDDTGTYTIPGCSSATTGCTFHDNDNEAAGPVTVTRALTVSSDIFFYNLGVDFWDAYKATGQYGEDPIQNTANSYGYGAVTGIDLPGETHDARVDSYQVVQKEHAQYPALYPNDSWYSGNNLEMAFGQGGTVITPLEQAVAYATFANGGTRYAPEIAAGLVDSSDGKTVQTYAPKVTGHVAMSAADYQAMLAGFEGVVQNPKGTAYAAFQGFPLSKFPLAGKTGTATTNEAQPNSWFIGFGPEPNPQYVIAVVVGGAGYGASVAAPIVRDGFQYLVAHPESTVVLAPPSQAGSSSSSSSTTTVPGKATGAAATTTTTAVARPTTTLGAGPSDRSRPVPAAGGTSTRAATAPSAEASAAASRPRGPPPRL